MDVKINNFIVIFDSLRRALNNQASNKHTKNFERKG